VGTALCADRRRYGRILINNRRYGYVRIFVGNNKTFVYPIFMSDLNQIWIFSADFHKIPQYQIWCKSAQWKQCWYMHKDGQTNRRRQEVLSATTLTRLMINMYHTSLKRNFRTSKRALNGSKVSEVPFFNIPSHSFSFARYALWQLPDFDEVVAMLSTDLCVKY
jgi:hypothetical protein